MVIYHVATIEKSEKKINSVSRFALYIIKMVLGLFKMVIRKLILWISGSKKNLFQRRKLVER